MKTNSRMATLLMTMVSTSVVHSQNVLPNGDFSDALQISGWTAVGTSSISFDVFVFGDADYQLGSGDMMIFAQSTVAAPQAVSACFAVTGGSSFQFGGKYASVDIFGVGFGAEMECKSYSDTNCTTADSELGLAGQQDKSQVNANPRFFSLVPASGLLSSTAKSAQCTVSSFTVDHGGFPDMSGAIRGGVDDLYFNLGSANSGGVPLGGYLSGSWYDPATSGQGFEIEFTAQADTLLATWFTYSPDNSGTTQWVYGQGTYDPTQSIVTIPAVLTSGTSFSPNFVKANVKKTPWGNLTFAFTDCNNATLTWNSTLPGYGSGTQHLQRLTSIAGLSCPH